MRKMTSCSIALAITIAAAVAGACHSSDDAKQGAGGASSTPPLNPTTTPLPTETSPPAVYVAKVKNILVGLAPTDDEVKSVEADPTKLSALIDTWMALPQYQTKMMRFFELAFQQTQITDVDFADQTFPKQFSVNRASTPEIVQNLTESFARTMLALIAAGRPLTDAMTTRTFMMTPALMEHYAFLDAWQVDDSGATADRFHAGHLTTTITVTSAAPIPLTDSVDPTSPNFMHWYMPNLAAIDAATVPGCFVDPVVFDANGQAGFAVQRILQGSLDGRKNPTAGAQACPPFAGATEGVLADTDFTTWKMVTIRAPKSKADPPTDFWDIPKIRAASELVLTIPRVGFFSTPAFFANWQTNTSNEMRVTTNQMLIVGLGAAVDGTDLTHPTSTPGLDAAHAGSPACFACHQTLDPTRSLLASQLSWNYHNQTEGAFATQPGMFQFQGVTKAVATLDDLGNVLATHPLFAQAWAQKLCYYANSRKCDEADPEFQRVVAAFTSSSFSWNALVRELLASPITTNATPTKTLDDQGEVIAVSRRDHLCAAIDNRLGFDDICQLRSTAAIAKGNKKPVATITEIVSGLPSDGYGRGSTAPVLPNQPSLFYRAGTENICEQVAELVIDPTTPTPGAKQWSGTSPDAAIADFVANVMALTPSDPRSAPSITALKAHFTAAVATGATASDALKSTFVVACLAPSSISVGL